MKVTNDVLAIACDACGAEFEPVIRTRRESDEGKIEVTYFVCPECSQEYEVCRTNPELRKLQQKVEQARARIVKQRATGRLKTERLEAFQELTGQLKEKTDEFNGKTKSVAQ